MRYWCSLLYVKQRSLRGDTMKWDVVIVGAGPAGATAAVHLAAKGHKVMLLDKKSFPRDKVCGDALIPDTLACLERMDILAKVEREGYKVGRIVAFSPSGIQFEIPGRFITLKRYRFDALLVEHAISCGAVFNQASVSEIHPHADGAILKTSLGYSIKTRVCLIATGANISLAQKNGLVEQSRPDAMALRCYVHSGVQMKDLMLSFDGSILPDCGWIFPLGKQEFNVGCALVVGKKSLENRNLGTLFGAFLASFPPARELLQRGRITSQVKGAPLRYGLPETNSAGTGNLLAIGEKWLTKAWIGDFIAHRANKSRFLRESFAGMVNETVDPRSIFFLRGLVRSLLT